jgi:hypothetical protein
MTAGRYGPRLFAISLSGDGQRQQRKQAVTMPSRSSPKSDQSNRTITPPVRWRDVAPTVRAAAATTDADLGTVAQLMIGLTEPLRQLDSLHDLANRAFSGDQHATRELKALLSGRQAQLGPPRLEDDDADCCHCHDGGRGPHRPHAIAQIAVESPLSLSSGPESAVLDSSGLIELMFAIGRVYAGADRDELTNATGVVASLALAATPIGGLVAAWQRDGELGVAGRIGEMGRLGQLEWLVRPSPVPMQTMSGGAPAGFSPGGLPGLPGGLPGLPGAMPGGLVPGLPDPGDLPGIGRARKTIEDLLDLLKPKRPGRWDPDDWCPTYPWWRDPLEWIDWYEIDRIRCFLHAWRLFNQRAAIAPPTRPARVTWSDGITSVESGGACAGDTVTIHGKGFPPRAKTVLLLPSLDGCTPVNVAPSNWSSKKITVVMPGGISSGPIGFADAAYVAAYDAWAAHQNSLADEIRASGCFTRDIPWVPPFRECPPATAVNHLRAGAPAIDAFTANGAVNAVIEPGVGVFLAWSVRNTEHVRVERISASGPTFGGSPSLVDPGSTFYALGAIGYSAPTEYRYRLTATGPCGSLTREVTVAASKRPGLRITGVEVTQSIQNTSNSVRLVESKPTIVRVTVGHGLAGFGSNTVANVKGRTRVRRSNGTRSGWFDAANGTSPMAPSPGASITVVASPQRNNTNDTLNFLIPPAWNSGTVSYEIEVRVAGFGNVGSFGGFSAQTSFTTGPFSFLHRRVLEFRYVRVNWGGNTPSAQTCLDTLRGAVPLLPTPTANISALAGVGVQTPTANTDGRDDLIDDFDDRHNCSVWEALTEWLGSDCPDEDGTIWILIPGVFFRGRAYDIPSNVCFTPPNDGPYAAHELSHCLDQVHLGIMCSNGQQAQGGDAPSSWPNNGQLADVPFDVTRNLALTLAGTGVFDVMSYCGSPNNTWPIPARWDRLWDQVGG